MKCFLHQMPVQVEVEVLITGWLSICLKVVAVPMSDSTGFCAFPSMVPETYFSHQTSQEQIQYLHLVIDQHNSLLVCDCFFVSNYQVAAMVRIWCSTRRLKGKLRKINRTKKRKEKRLDLARNNYLAKKLGINTQITRKQESTPRHWKIPTTNFIQRSYVFIKNQSNPLKPQNKIQIP